MGGLHSLPISCLAWWVLHLANWDLILSVIAPLLPSLARFSQHKPLDGDIFVFQWFQCLPISGFIPTWLQLWLEGDLAGSWALHPSIPPCRINIQEHHSSSQCTVFLIAVASLVHRHRKPLHWTRETQLYLVLWRIPGVLDPVVVDRGLRCSTVCGSSRQTKETVKEIINWKTSEAENLPK